MLLFLFMCGPSHLSCSGNWRQSEFSTNNLSEVRLVKFRKLLPSLSCWILREIAVKVKQNLTIHSAKLGSGLRDVVSSQALSTQHPSIPPKLTQTTLSTNSTTNSYLRLSSRMIIIVSGTLSKDKVMSKIMLLGENTNVQMSGNVSC